MAWRWNAASRLWRKHALAIGGLVGASLVALGLTEMAYTWGEARQQVGRAQRAQAEEVAFAVRSALGAVERQLGAITVLPWSAQGWLTLEDRRAEYQRLLRIAPAVDSVSHVDAAGQTALTVSRRDPDLINPTREVAPGSDVTKPAAASLQCVYADVLYDAGYEPVLGLELTSNEGASGRTQARVNLRALAAELKATLQPSGAIAYVSDHSGRVVLAADTRLMLEQRVHPALLADGVAAAAAPREAVPRDGLEGEAVIATALALPRLGWTVHVEQPRAAALAPVYATLGRVAAFTLVGVALALALSMGLTQRLTGPVLALSATAQRLGRGDLDARAEPGHHDELDNLAHAFNQMAGNLQDLYRNLEAKVAEKTADLAAANAALQEWSRTLEERVAQKVSEVEHLSRLKRFFSPALAERLVSAPADDPLRSHRREVSVLFADLRGFTAFADQHHERPDEVMQVLAEFHELMGRLVHARNATLERFTGDGMMVFLNDPEPVADHAQQAVALGLDMQRGARGLCEHWRARGIDLGLGVGVSTGTATLGAIGFRERIDYAAIGMVTNIAARLCAEARAGEVLVSGAMVPAGAPASARAERRELQLKGVARPVQAVALVPT